jgi:hypothetical protein
MYTTQEESLDNHAQIQTIKPSIICSSYRQQYAVNMCKHRFFKITMSVKKAVQLNHYVSLPANIWNSSETAEIGGQCLLQQKQLTMPKICKVGGWYGLKIFVGFGYIVYFSFCGAPLKSYSIYLFWTRTQRRSKEAEKISRHKKYISEAQGAQLDFQLFSCRDVGKPYLVHSFRNT